MPDIYRQKQREREEPLGYERTENITESDEQSTDKLFSNRIGSYKRTTSIGSSQNHFWDWW